MASTGFEERARRIAAARQPASPAPELNGQPGGHPGGRRGQKPLTSLGILLLVSAHLTWRYFRSVWNEGAEEDDLLLIALAVAIFLCVIAGLSSFWRSWTGPSPARGRRLGRPGWIITAIIGLGLGLLPSIAINQPEALGLDPWGLAPILLSVACYLIALAFLVVAPFFNGRGLWRIPLFVALIEGIIWAMVMLGL